MTESILQEAERLINGDRQSAYGSPAESLGRIADMWAAYLEHPVNAYDVANLMILLKISRSKNGTDGGEWHRDDDVDISGYAGLKEQVSVAQTPPVPRQWSRLSDVPPGVTVSDDDRDHWKLIDGTWHIKYVGTAPERPADEQRFEADYDPNDAVGPFTEVLEEDK